MRPRLLWLLCTLPLVFLLVASLWLLFGGARRVTKANFDKIQMGMTIREVDDLFANDNKQGRSQGALLNVTWVRYFDDDGLMPGADIEVTFWESNGELRVTEKKYWSPTMQETWQLFREGLMIRIAGWLE